MSLSRFILGAAAAAFIGIAIPAAAHAQAKTACKDGTTTTATGAKACEGHGGIHGVHTTINNRAPSRSTKPTEVPRVAQAGVPKADRQERPRYEERRGWRWGRHHDDDKKGHDEKHRRVRCRDGKWDKVVGKGREVCKHHGGIAH